MTETALARALYLARRYEAAIAQCRRALELDPDYILAHFNLGCVLVETGQTGETIMESQEGRERISLRENMLGQTVLDRFESDQFQGQLRRVPPNGQAQVSRQYSRGIVAAESCDVAARVG